MKSPAAEVPARFAPCRRLPVQATVMALRTERKGKGGVPWERGLEKLRLGRKTTSPERQDARVFQGWNAVKVDGLN